MFGAGWESGRGSGAGGDSKARARGWGSRNAVLRVSGAGRESGRGGAVAPEVAQGPARARWLKGPRERGWGSKSAVRRVSGVGRSRGGGAPPEPGRMGIENRGAEGVRGGC